MTRTISAGALLAVLLILIAPLGNAEDHSSLDLDAQRGKVLILDFWASWCVPCRRSFPWLNSMHDKYGDDDLVIIGVNVDSERAEADRFLAEYPARFRVHFDGHGELAAKFGVEAMPSSYVIGRDGQIRTRHLGFKVQRQDEYEAAIVAALQEEGDQ